MADLGKLLVKIESDVTKLKSGLATGEKGLKGFAQSATKILKTVGIAFVAMGAAASVALTKVFKDSIKLGVAMDDISKIAGLTATEFAELAFVVEQEHGSVQALVKTFPILAKNMSEAADDVATYKDEFEELGVEVKDQEGNLRNLKDVFFDIADGVKKHTNQTRALAAASLILGRGGKELFNVFKLGREGIQKLTDEFEEIALLTPKQRDEFSASAKLFDDKITSLKFIFQDLGLVITNEMLPVVEEFINKLSEADWKAISKDVKDVATALLQIGEAAAKAILAVKGFFDLANQRRDAILAAGGRVNPLTGEILSGPPGTVPGPGGAFIGGTDAGAFGSGIPGAGSEVAKAEDILPPEEDAIDEKTGLLDSLIEKMNEVEAEWTDINKQLTNVFMASIDQFTTGLGTALAASIVDGENFSDAFKQLWKDIAKSVIAAIVKMIAKLVILFTWQVLTGTVGQGSGGGLGKIFGLRQGGFVAKNGIAFAGGRPISAQNGVATTGSFGEAGIPVVAHPGEVIAPIDKLFDLIKNVRGNEVNIRVDGGSQDPTVIAELVAIEIERKQRAP